MITCCTIIYLTEIQGFLLLPFPFYTFHHVHSSPSFPLFSFLLPSLFFSFSLPALLQSVIQHSSLSLWESCYVIQSSVRESLWASRRLSLLHQQPIQNCCFFFNSLRCYLKLSQHSQKQEKISMSAGWQQTFYNDCHSLLYHIRRHRVYTICTCARVCACIEMCHGCVLVGHFWVFMRSPVIQKFAKKSLSSCLFLYWMLSAMVMWKSCRIKV